MTTVTSSPYRPQRSTSRFTYDPGHRYLPASKHWDCPNLSLHFVCFNTCWFPALALPVILHDLREKVNQHLCSYMELCALNESSSKAHIFLALAWLGEMGMSRVDYARSKWQHSLCQLSCAGRHSLGWKESCASSPPLCPLPAHSLLHKCADSWVLHVKSRH